MSVYVGLDIGGTAIKHGVMSSSGSLVEDSSLPTTKGDREQLMTQLKNLVEHYQAKHDVSGVGIGTAGTVDFETGTLLGHSPNISNWAGTPLAAVLEDRIRLPVAVDNDANCMAIAEMAEGAGKGCQSVFFLTLGTGVGSAVVVNGRLWRGAHSMGGEWGHSTIVQNGRVCSCGKRGHLEAYASASALVSLMLELADQGLPSLYTDVSEAARAALGSKEVFAAANGGDAAAAQAVSETATYLATGIASAVNLLDPEVVVIGGGMADAGNPFMETVRAGVNERVHAGLTDRVRVEPAVLGNRAGLLGAAMLVRNRLEKIPE